MTTTLVSLLQESAQRFPDAEAVVYKEFRVTYSQLWKEIRKLGTWFKQNGLQQGDRVALVLENSPHYICAYYAVLAYGGVVVALNTAAKAKDIRNWVAHSDAKWLLIDAQNPQSATIQQDLPIGAEILPIEISKPLAQGITQLGKVSDEVIKRHPMPALQLEQIAAIIYTSGTTGDPKGVTLSHGNLIHNIHSILAYLKLSQSDRILNVLPFYYSYGNSVLHTHLAVGGCLVLENTLAYPHHVVQKMVDESVTGFSGVPSTFALLLNRVKLNDYDLSKLRYMTQAGGKMPAAQISRITKMLPNVDFFVMYGQTEATARIAYLPPEKLEEKIGSAGIPIDGVTVEIRDEAGNTVPPGTVGEIFVHGKNLMQGYWNSPQASDKVIYNGWLKTGDLAYMDEEGYLFIQGRNSEMIKAGANRISPQEIEEVITQLEAVAEVAVVGVPDEILGEVIKAVVVKREGYQLQKRDVQSYCRKSLAIYKIPKYVEFAEELPKTASGKVKRYMLAK